MTYHNHIAPDVKAKNNSAAGTVFFQPKLQVNSPGDTYEHEADAMADKMMQPQENNYFFKPQIPAPGVVQRLPQPANTTNAGQAPTNQTQNQNQNQAINATKRQIPSGPISRQEFDDYVKKYFSVQDIHDGTQKEQEESLTGRNGVKPSISGWTAWNPGATSDQYSSIIQAIEDVAGTFGAIPNLNSIRFFEVYYEVDSTGVAIKQPDTGAYYGAGGLTIFKAYSENRAFPNARSNAAGNYPPAGFVLSGAGSTPGAPRPLQSKDQSLKENIVHELGHGIAESAHDADPQVFVNYGKAVGWVGTALYDIGQLAVQTAIAGGQTPPTQYKIEPDNWNDPKWIEQPMSNYAVFGGLSEDFAESIAAFQYSRNVLMARSPARYKFITDNMSKWATKMRSVPPPRQVGDFPAPDPNKQYA